MGFAERLKQFIDYQGVSFREFDSKAGIGNGYAKKITEGANSPTIATVEKIIQAFPNLNSEWLLSGKGKMIIEYSDNSYSHQVHEPIEKYGKISEITIEKQETKGVPIYNLEFSAGLPTLINSGIHNNIIGYMDLPELKSAEAIIKVKGDSMKGLIEDGQWLAIRKLKSLDIIPYGSIFAILTVDELPLLKIVKKGSTSDMLKLVSYNSEDYEEFEIPISKIHSMYIALDVIPIRGLAL